MRDEPSRFARILTRFVLVLCAVMVALGIYWYGWSMEVNERFWSDIFARAHGPMTFRFYLQPTMAAIAAVHGGINDARYGHRAFFWTALWDQTQRTGRLKQGLISTARIMLLGISMDVVYQLRVEHRFYPAEAVMIAILLAVIPYFVFRWIVEQVARWWFARRKSNSTA